MTLQLTTRSPGELLQMEFSPEDLFLESGIFAKRQPLVILGPGGVGKSRFVLQFLGSAITGMNFLGWSFTPRATPPRVLIIQAENSNRRLQADLASLRRLVGEDAWPMIEENLVIHTIEHEHDAALNLSDDQS